MSIPGFDIVDSETGEVIEKGARQKNPGRRHYNPDGTPNLQPKGRFQPFQVRLPKALHTAFRRKAHRSKESMNTIITELVRHWVLGKIDLEVDVQRAMSEARRRHKAQS